MTPSDLRKGNVLTATKPDGRTHELIVGDTVGDYTIVLDYDIVGHLSYVGDTGYEGFEWFLTWPGAGWGFACRVDEC